MRCAVRRNRRNALCCIDLSAAFDTVDDHILLHRLQHFWHRPPLVSLLPHGKDRVRSPGGCEIPPPHCCLWGPPGLCARPTLFTIYMLSLGRVVSWHGIQFHCYGDETQLYLKVTPSSTPPSSVAQLDSCLEEIKAWMSENFLQLNSSKTEAIHVGTSHQLRSPPH